MHGKVFFLSDHWDDFLLRWDHVEQQGWGTQARFDPARIVSLQFAVKPPNLPADFWVDDIAYVTEPDAAKLAAAIHAEPVAAPAPPPTTPHSPLPAGKATGSGKSP